MQLRHGGVAALVLLGAACGLSSPAGERLADPGLISHSSPAVVDDASSSTGPTSMAPAPTPSAIRVLVTGTSSAEDPGLDAAVSVLAHRPDLRIEVALPSGAAVGARTMSGFPVTTAPGTLTDVVTARRVDLVVVGLTIFRPGSPAGMEQLARASEAARHASSVGVPAIVVAIEGPGADYAAGAMALLDVIDAELGRLLATSGPAVRILVPTCRDGSLRGIIEVDEGLPGDPSDCIAPPAHHLGDEATGVAGGFVTLATLGSGQAIP